MLTETLRAMPGIAPTAIPMPGVTESHAAPIGAAVKLSVLPIGSPFEIVSVCAAGVCPGFAKKASDAGDGTSEGPNFKLHALRPCVEAKS